jgi:3-oxoacyl-[acyl-carrier protein] reductase
MDLGIDGKVAIVTGAASKRGIGRAIALTLAKEGVDVAVADIILEGVQAVAQEIKEIGRRSTAIKVDQGVYEEVKNAVAQINEEFGRIDILVNNAAITSNMGAVRKMEPSKWANELNVNLSGPWYWTREVLPLMIQNKWGRIVNISSMAWRIGGLGLPAYAASKGGLVSLTKATAREGGPRGVTANSVTLGMIDSGVYERGPMDPKVVEGLKAKTLLNRMGEVSEVADAVAFLCSDRASYIIGVDIPIDAGVLINI